MAWELSNFHEEHASSADCRTQMTLWWLDGHRWQGIHLREPIPAVWRPHCSLSRSVISILSQFSSSVGYQANAGIDINTMYICARRNESLQGIQKEERLNPVLFSWTPPWMSYSRPGSPLSLCAQCCCVTLQQTPHSPRQWATSTSIPSSKQGKHLQLRDTKWDPRLWLYCGS